MKKLSIVILALFICIGCSTNGALSNKKTLNRNLTIPVQGNKVSLFLVTEGKVALFNSGILIESKLLDNLSENSKKVVAEQCVSSDPAELSPIVIPLISTIGKYIFDRSIDKKQEKLTALKKAAQNSYSAKMVLPNSYFKKASCTILVRYKIKNNKIELGLVAITKLHHIGGKNPSFVLKPVFVDANNAVVKTRDKRKVKDKEIPSTINIDIGFSLKTIGLNKNGTPTLMSIGETAVSVSKVDLANIDANACDNNKCGYSDQIAHSFNDTDTLSFSVSINETGNVGINFDQRKSQLAAMKEAFGPAIKDTITNALTDD